ncbi:MAG: DNA polymerase III subunit gamma/tau, partial [Deltaproteobacteria bacterium]|nr:DNA polymerase III subunit gamma/tau [Deltaproteobacteria bacterium]
MSYVVLARKWRPMSFEDLVGQEHVSRTLGNAIQSGRVAHAFLFTGVRGVGKTTSARILAKALNCTGTAEAPRSGPTVTPCLQCSACREIATGNDVDVREIDGASYTGVDEVRKLQESLPYRPTRDRYKIFIVDEVHMLSANAWNAFLKTLEEPPPHVKFIFATTEAHKVPITILSRVQRFDFKLIPTQLVVARLRHVLDAEKIAADTAALGIIAREAAGSMRDAMSLLDQVIAWNDQALDVASVARVLGVASRQVLHDAARALVTGDAPRCLEVVAALAAEGFDVTVVARDLLSLLRDLVVARVCAEPGELLDLAEDERRDVAELAAAADADDLLRLHQAFSQGFDDVARGGQPRAALEMLLVRLARRPPLVPIDELLHRLAALERRAPGGGGAPGAGPSRP